MEQLPDLIQRALRARALGGRHYKKSDANMELVLKVMKPGDQVTLKSGQTIRLVDRYATKNTVFQPTGVRRYELEELTTP